MEIVKPRNLPAVLLIFIGAIVCFYSQPAEGWNEFVCKDSGKKLTYFQHCDGVKNCADNSDEEIFNKRDKFACKNGKQCFSNWKKCNGKKDCKDGSDEIGCAKKTCRHGDFSCANGYRCINMYSRCDGHNDCGDHSDELPDDVMKQGRQSKYFACADGKKCLKAYKRCNGRKDCHDGSDESKAECSGCSSNYHFKCNNGQCIEKKGRCNTYIECRDRSDEMGCYKTPSCKWKAHSKQYIAKNNFKKIREVSLEKCKYHCAKNKCKTLEYEKLPDIREHFTTRPGGNCHLSMLTYAEAEKKKLIRKSKKYSVYECISTTT